MHDVLRAELIVKHALLSTVIVAAAATAGDWIWAAFLPRHLMTAGLAHGALLCLAMGAVLGIPQRRVAAGAASGVAVGVAAAALFYLLAPVLRMGAMLPAWFVLWLMLAAVSRNFSRERRSWREMVVRGVIASLLSGAAFYLVSGMWLRWDPASINYADHFGRWALALAPGFAALQARRDAPV